jgi:methionyl-tRNA formyltransferase
LDAGDIIAQNTFTVFPDDTSTKIYSRVVFLAKMIAETFLPMLENGTAPRTKQDESKAYIFKKPPKDFNRINPDDDITYTERKIRALQFPYNGAYIESKGKKLIIEKVRME